MFVGITLVLVTYWVTHWSVLDAWWAWLSFGAHWTGCNCLIDEPCPGVLLILCKSGLVKSNKYVLSMAVTDLCAYGDVWWAWPWCGRHRNSQNTGKACHQSETSHVCSGHWWSCIPFHTDCTCRGDLCCDAGCGQPDEPGKIQIVTTNPISITETRLSLHKEKLPWQETNTSVDRAYCASSFILFNNFANQA